jgi:hypothetical protein
MAVAGGKIRITPLFLVVLVGLAGQERQTLQTQHPLLQQTEVVAAAAVVQFWAMVEREVLA